MSGAPDHVVIEIEAVPAAIAQAWTDHCRQLVAAVRGARSLSITIDEDMLELLDSILSLWQSVAGRGDEFRWRFSTSPEQVVRITEQWLQIGSLTDEDLRAIGMTWAPPSTRPMSDAVTTAVLAACRVAGDEGAHLLARLGGGSAMMPR